MSFITTLKTNKISNNKIFYCNFETITYKESCIVVCYSIYNEVEGISITKSILFENQIHITEVQNKSYEIIEAFLNDCFTIKKRFIKFNVNFFFHNFSNFNSFFLMQNLCLQDEYSFDIILRENVIYKCKVIKKNDISLDLIFRDSSLLIQIPLDKLKNLFNIERTYSVANYDIKEGILYQNILANVKDNCLNNVIFFQNISDIFVKSILSLFNINPFDSLSLSSLSMKIFRQYFYDANNYPIEIINENKEDFIKSSYFGGVVDVYKPILNNGYHYDINSLYPFVMKEYDMPIGEGVFIDNFDTFDFDSFFGFLDVTIFFYSLNISSTIPSLPFYHKEKGLICPKGTWRGTYFSEELKYAKKQGYIIKVHRALSFKRGKLFKKFVEYIYEIRILYKKTPLESIIKLIMNSLYGRFGMRSDLSKISVFKSENFSDIKKVLFLHEIQSINDLKDKTILKHSLNPSLTKLNQALNSEFISKDEYSFFVSKLKKINQSNVAIQIASAIAAYARIEMHKYKMNTNYNVFYSDTDSLFTDKPLPSGFVSDVEIGKFKLEGQVLNAFFAAPKLYCVNYSDGRKLIKSKGLASGNVTEDIIKDIVYEKRTENIFNITNVVRDRKTFKLYHKTSLYKMSGQFLKRQKQYTNNIWSHTTPFYIFKLKKH